jgi:hypothetical protein
MNFVRKQECFKIEFPFLACECNPTGSQNNACDRESGQCQCQRNYGSRQCEECNNGFYNYPSCSSKSLQMLAIKIPNEG